MKQQGVHPEGTEDTSEVSPRPGADGTGHERERTAAEPATDYADDEAHAEEVEGDEPLLPARVHRPSDLMRLLAGVFAIVVLLAIAAFAHGTTSGLEQDINKGTGQAPDLLIKIAGLASSIAILLVPVAFAIDLPSEVLPTPGGPTRHNIGPDSLLARVCTARYSTMRSFTLSSP
jgi:hypothetical protein